MASYFDFENKKDRFTCTKKEINIKYEPVVPNADDDWFNCDPRKQVKARKALTRDTPIQIAGK